MSVTFPSVGIQTAKYANVAGLGLLVFDYCITLSSEVHWMWGKKWEATRIVFTFSRYLPFAAVGMTSYSALNFREDEDCSHFSWASDLLHVTSIVFAEGLLVLRAYAFWHRSRRLLTALLVLAAIFIAAAEGLSIFVDDAEPSSTSTTSSDECVFQTGRGSAIQYGFLIVYETMLLCLTTFRQFRHYRETNSPLILALYQDGVTYIACISWRFNYKHCHRCRCSGFIQRIIGLAAGHHTQRPCIPYLVQPSSK
ncbi:hypothetical protein BV22DRAFT_810748 [Leucogyrophana mollusca]|uniref:Uncharacterized protein n=1 Tax=Leucogyrophana mollusca TaxID=85980 RepID=A0ACB8B3L5_9AGAM|nr:hypothetical protein BV22DRAFT_810748 [Leucogyrophana mollusca]